MIGRSLLAGMVFAMTVTAVAASEPVVRGLDHIPLAVNDLEASRADFEALGFVLKPGRPHENGLRNLHAKFPDGTEIELITVGAPTDALTLRYRAWLNIGDGPAFLGLYAPDFGALAQRLTRSGSTLQVSGGLGVLSESIELQHLFFAHRQRSTTDRPEHFDHVNTAYGLAGVWFAGAEVELNFFSHCSEQCQRGRRAAAHSARARRHSRSRKPNSCFFPPPPRPCRAGPLSAPPLW